MATALISAVEGTVRFVGLDESRAVLRDIGAAYAEASANRHRLKRATDNLRWCFPGWPERRIHDVAVESYRNLFGLGAEMCCAPHYFGGDYWPQRVVLGESPLVQQAIDLLLDRQPCVLISGHCGNWEVLGMTIAHFGFDLHAVYRPLDFAPLDAWVRTTRGRNGLRLIDKFGATEQLPAIIASRDSIGFTADQNAGAGGLFVPFFDRLASTYKSIGLLSLRFEIPLVCGHATRIRDVATGALGYRIEVQDIIRPPDWAGQPDPLYYVTARYRRAIEDMVRVAPEQYLWMHRYWKSRPKFEKKGLPLPEALERKIRDLPWITDEQVERIRRRSIADAAEASARGAD